MGWLYSLPCTVPSGLVEDLWKLGNHLLSCKQIEYSLFGLDHSMKFVCLIHINHTRIKLLDQEGGEELEGRNLWPTQELQL